MAGRKGNGGAPLRATLSAAGHGVVPNEIRPVADAPFFDMRALTDDAWPRTRAATAAPAASA